METIFNLLLSHSSEIGTFIVTALVGLAKRWYDKRQIKLSMHMEGIEHETIKKII